MKKALLASLAYLLAGCGEAADESANYISDADVDEARNAAVMLGATLKGELLAAIQADGPASAISVCNETAPEISTMVLAETGMDVQRTALRVRNRANAPDDWEFRQMQAFLKRQADGEDMSRVEVSDIQIVDGVETFRWMKPIMTGELCTLCHGEVLDETVTQAIQAQYPEDQATGFAAGEMRGAFTVSKVLEQGG